MNITDITDKFNPLVLVATLLYGLSLILPVTIYRPDTLDNEKYGFCSLATRDEYRCLKKGQAFSCTFVQTGATGHPDAMSRSDVDDYCGTGWDEPRARHESGLTALLNGWRYFQAGSFSWYAHIFLIASFLFAWNHKPRSAAASALAAVALTVTAFLVTRLPRIGGGNDLIVDYLGIGYFVWVAALALFAWYHLTNLFKRID